MFEEYNFQRDFLNKLTFKKEIPRVLIFSGRDLDKLEKIAIEFVKNINCQEKTNNGKSCQKCYFCEAIEKKQFPDLIFISPGDKNEISIEYIRELKEKLNFKPFISEFKIVIIKSAQLMNDFSQNALLKILEEGAGNQIIFILLVDNFRKLKETIISRGIILKFPSFENNFISKENFVFLEKIFGNYDLVAKFLFLNSFLENIKEKKLGKKEKIIKLFDDIICFLRIILLYKIGIRNIILPFEDYRFLEKYDFLEIKRILEFAIDLKNNIFIKNINERLAIENLILNLK